MVFSTQLDIGELNVKSKFGVDSIDSDFENFYNMFDYNNWNVDLFCRTPSK